MPEERKERLDDEEDVLRGDSDQSDSAPTRIAKSRYLCAVAKEPVYVRNKFVWRVSSILLIALLFTFIPVGLCVKVTPIRDAFDGVRWVYAVIAAAALLVLVIYRLSHFAAWGPYAQLVLLFFIMLVVTSMTCLLTLWFDSMFFIRAVLLMSICVLVIWLYTFQRRWVFSACLAIVLLVVGYGLGTYFILIQPHIDSLSSFSSVVFFSKDDKAWEDVATALLGLVFSVFVIWKFNGLAHVCNRKMTYYAAARMYVDIAKVMLLPLALFLPYFEFGNPEAGSEHLEHGDDKNMERKPAKSRGKRQKRPKRPKRPKRKMGYERV